MSLVHQQRFQILATGVRSGCAVASKSTKRDNSHKSFAFASCPRDARRSRATKTSSSQRSHLIVLIPLSFAGALVFPRLDHFLDFSFPFAPSSLTSRLSIRVTKHQPTPLVLAASKSPLFKVALIARGPLQIRPLVWTPACYRTFSYCMYLDISAPLSVSFSLSFCLNFT